MTTKREDLIAEKVGLVTGNYLLIRTHNNWRWVLLRAVSLKEVEVSLAVGHSKHRDYCEEILDLPEPLFALALEVITYLESGHSPSEAREFARGVFNRCGMPAWIRGYHR
ncbi:MAG: hypothetical protein WAV09_02630 [Minisyncoccia bacterium]